MIGGNDRYLTIHGDAAARRHHSEGWGIVPLDDGCCNAEVPALATMTDRAGPALATITAGLAA